MLGKTLLHYQILEQLGEGGMGVVYKARDTRLGRFVAIKVLQAEHLASRDRKARFVQEAKAASALNHPNIITIYDIGADSGCDFIAMEYLAGKTLAHLIPHNGMRLNEALKIAVQIADALARAHSVGIVHRDVKPANIMVDEHGLVKVLDFGLAKLTERVDDESADTETQTPRTEAGTIAGTAGYMSPEQAAGGKIDARSDIFSFGAVLYEMMSGRRAFQGGNRVATLSAILHQDPPPIEGVPPDLDKLIARCLRKDPERRAQHMADVRLALQDLKEESESGKLAQSGVAPKPRRWRLAIAGGAILAAIVIAGVVLWIRGASPPAAPAPLMRLTSDSGLTTTPALSPDGKLVAYASDRAGGDNLDIWVQQIDGGVPLRLTSDHADEYEPSFSPDGNRIVYRSDRDGGGIYIIPALGGEPRKLAGEGRSPRFSPDGATVAFVGGLGGLGGGVRRGLFAVPSAGGDPARLAPDVLGAANPVWSPDGRYILFASGFYRRDDWAVVSSQAGSAASLVVLPLGQFKKQAGLADVFPHEWLDGGRVLFSARSGDSSHLYEAGLSPPGMAAKEWRLDPTPKRLTSGAGQDESPSLSAARTAKGGRRMVFASVIRNEHIFNLALDTNHPRLGGKVQLLTQESGFQIFPSMSRDGTKLVFLSHTAYNDEVWLVDLTTGKRSLLSNTVSRKFKPVIHRDGSRVIYDVNSGDQSERGIFGVSTAGGTPAKLCGNCGWPWDWSPDHKLILHWGRPRSSVAAAMWNVETGKPGVFLESPGKDLYQFHWSPDGQWIVFSAKGVQVAPVSGDRGPVESAWIPITDGSTDEGVPSWSHDGNWIYTFSSRDGFRCLWAYPLDPRTKRPSGKPVAVFHSHGSRLSLRNADDVSQEMSVARDKIVFNQGEITGNIWMTEYRPD